MRHESINQIQSTIQSILCQHELQHKSVRIARYHEASYFAFSGNFVYLIVDFPLGGAPTICYVGATTHLGRTLTVHRNNHEFTHAFVVDVFDSDETTREIVKSLLVNHFSPIFQKTYVQCGKYRVNNFRRPLTTEEVYHWHNNRIDLVR